MVDLRFIRAHEAEVREAIRKKHERADVDAILELDRQRRELLGQVEAQKAQRNRQSQEIGTRKVAGEDTAEAVAAMREVSQQIKKTDAQISEIVQKIEQQLQWVPTLPHP